MSGLEHLGVELATGGLTAAALKRLFGGSVGEIGDALTRFTGSRLRNVGRVVEKADQKSAPKAPCRSGSHWRS